MKSQGTQVPTTVLFPPATVALARTSAMTLLATFGLCILFLIAAITLAPGATSRALAAPAPAVEQPVAQKLAALSSAEARQ